MDDIAGRLLNPGVILTMIVAGVAYGRLLWAVNLRPNSTLWMIAAAPGAIFLMTAWTIRAMQGVPSVVWVVLLLDWLLFAHAGVLAVLFVRGRKIRR